MADKSSSVTTALDRMVTCATPDLALNALKGTAEMMTNPVEMFREMFGVMTNPMRVFTLGERLLSGRPLSESATGAGDDRPQSKTRAGQPMGGVVIEYPKIANGAVERVLAFNNHEYIALKGPDEAPFFSSHGPLTDLQGNTLPGTRLGTTFPVDPKTFPETGVWPVSQVEPFDEPPVNFKKGVTNHGYSKQAYYFNDDKDWFVTVGPSLPKITTTKEGGAQFWVGSIGAIAQGGGIYEGARGVTTYVGSGFFEKWPLASDFEGQIKLLRTGFTALVGTYVKMVLKEHVGK